METVSNLTNNTLIIYSTVLVLFKWIDLLLQPMRLQNCIIPFITNKVQLVLMPLLKKTGIIILILSILHLVLLADL